MTHLDIGKPLVLEDGSSFPRPPLESDDDYSPIHTVCWQGHEKITRGEAMWLVSMAEAFIYLVANPGEARKKIPMIRRALENEVPDDRD